MLKLLLVEDETRIRELFGQFLRMKGYHVEEARDGQEAVDMVARSAFDLVLMDIKMPRLNGMAALDQVRRIAPSTKVLLMTGFGANAELEASLQDGVVAYLPKPLTFNQLTATIEQMTARPEDPSGHRGHGSGKRY